MTVNELSSGCGFKAVALPDGEKEVSGGYAGDLLSWVMGRAKEGCAWITIMSNINIIAVASLADVACIILAEGVGVDESVKKTAEEKGVNILSTELPAYETAALISKEI
ncbi:MAG: DRTGG domain-containing protein [Acutalibacteraceae bacterium]|nr:DRTGG domain-containing protein [Oscillospiraceae bacterium]